MTVSTPAGGQSRDEFLARLRHDLRTPLNAIVGYSEMLLEDAQAAGEAASGLCRGLERIAAAGRELLAQITSLLDPTAGDAAAMDLPALRTDITLGLLAPAQDLLADGDRLLAEVRAAGPQFESCLPDLERVRTASAELVALVRQALGADFDPRPGPVSQKPPSAHPTAPARAAALLGSLLVVDDDEINRELLSRHLARQGHSVATAADGRLALEQLRRAPFDLVLLDVIMPDMDGYQTLAHMKADGALRDIPVIVISALDEIDSVVRCIEMGAEDYLPKPFDPVLLRARIEACLEKKRLRDQEVDYLNNVSLVTAAAAAVEADRFDAESLDSVTARGDALGQLARVFQRMAREVRQREERLRQQVQALRIEIDETRKARQVAEITETEYFQELQRKARRLRAGSAAGRRAREADEG
jgi:CheY-like chemotaxis protein